MNVREELLREKIDPHLTDENLSGLVTEALGVRSRCDGWTVLTGGCWNRVVSVTVDGGKRRVVVKITPTPGDPALRREFEVLRRFRGGTAMPVPEPYLLDLGGERIPGSLLVMEQLPGEVMSAIVSTLTADERERISEQIAEHVADLHTRQGDGFGGVEVPAGGRCATWAEFWVPRWDAAVADARERNLLDGELLAGLAELRRRFPALLDIGPRGTITHYDLWTGNVMVDRNGGGVLVSGFLDVAGYYADYARELSSMFSLADERLMNAYGRRHGFDGGFRERCDAYRLKMCLQMMVMYPAERRHADDARRFLGQALASCAGRR